MKVKTIQTHTYDDVQRTVGQEYDMDTKFYKHMAAMGHVVGINAPPAVRTKDLEADKPGKYRRRDLSADKQH